jgi:hypothetical protein
VFSWAIVFAKWKKINNQIGKNLSVFKSFLSHQKLEK